MACSTEFIDFVCDTLSPLGEVRNRKMMGDYVIYVNEKCVITACDNTAFVKKLPCIESLMADAETGLPYPGAKEAYILDVSNQSLVLKVISILWDNLPFPKSKTKIKSFNPPTGKELLSLIGESLYGIWQSLCRLIDEKYEMEHVWNQGGKAWRYEYKYRRGGKTLCALYARENHIGFMVILGKDERQKFEEDRSNYSEQAQAAYDSAQTYHDGKWIMFEPNDTSLFNDFLKLLQIKRKPNKK